MGGGSPLNNYTHVKHERNGIMILTVQFMSISAVTRSIEGGALVLWKRVQYLNEHL